MFIKINIIGVLYAPEVILLLCFLFLFPKNYHLIKSQITPFIPLTLLFLFSQVISDLYRVSLSEDYLRGWANIILFLINTITLFILLDNNKEKFFIFGIGIAIGLILSYLLSPNIYVQSGLVWKFGYGYAITFLIALLTTRSFFQNELFKSLIFLFLGFINFYFGFRSLAGICLLVFIFSTLMKYKVVNRFMYDKKSGKSKIFGIFCFFLFASFLVNYTYTFLVTNSYLGYDETIKFQTQSGPLGVLIGGRQELLSSIYAIYQSPIIGYGSWAKSPFSDGLLTDLLSQLGYYTPAVSYFGDRIPTHSHIFGAWITAGIFGVFIWFWFLYKAIKSILINSLNKDNWNSFFYFVSILMIWHLFFNHFNGSARFYDGYYLCIILYINRRLNFDGK